MNWISKPTLCVDPDAEEFLMRSVKALMLAVLHDAVRCYQDRAHGRAREYAEVRSWLFDRHADGPFAFETICQVLRIDSDYLRRGLRQSSLPLSGAKQRRLRRTPATSEYQIGMPRRRPARVIADEARVIPVGGVTVRRRRQSG